jgi:predicted nucleotidyltransferase/predicted transcriptional regulator
MRIKRPLDDVFGNPNNVRVLRHMILYPSPVITGRGIARELGMSHATCIRSLNNLVDLGILSRKRVGSSATYEIAEASALLNDILEPAFKEESRLLQGLVDTMLGGIKGKVLTAYLFGSVARGEDTPSSDVDLLVIVKQPGDKPSVEKALARNREQAYKRYRVGVSTITYDYEEFKKMKVQKHPLVKEFVKEGILLSGKEVR